MGAILLGNFKFVSSISKYLLYPPLQFHACDYYLRYVRGSPRYPVRTGSALAGVLSVCTGRVNGTLFFGTHVDYSQESKAATDPCHVGYKGHHTATDMFRLDTTRPLTYDTLIKDPISITTLKNGSRIILCTMRYQFLSLDPTFEDLLAGWTLDIPGRPCHIGYEGKMVTSQSANLPFSYVNMAPISY